MVFWTSLSPPVAAVFYATPPVANITLLIRRLLSPSILPVEHTKMNKSPQTAQQFDKTSTRALGPPGPPLRGMPRCRSGLGQFVFLVNAPLAVTCWYVTMLHAGGYDLSLPEPLLGRLPGVTFATICFLVSCFVLPVVAIMWG